MNNSFQLILSFISYSIFTILTLYIDKRRFNSITSPYSIFVGGNFFVLILCFFGRGIMHYYSLSSILILFTMLISFLFFIVEFSILFFKGNLNTVMENDSKHSSEFLEKVTIFFLIIEFLILLRLIKTYGIFGIISESFTNVYAHGLSGHILVFLQLVMVYYIGNIERTPAKIICILIVFLEFIVGIFHWVAFPIVGGLIYRIMIKKIAITLSKILFIGLTSIILFVSSYGIYILVSKKSANQQITSDTYNEIVSYHRHFFNYLFSGSLGASVKIESKIINRNGFNAIANMFLPLYNIIKVFSGGYFTMDYFEELSIRSWSKRAFIQISSFGYETNVVGIFGGLYISFGYISASIFILGLSLISSILFFTVRKSKTLFIKLYYSFFSVGLFFSWFNNFFNILEFYETAVYVLFLYFGDKYISKKMIKRVFSNG